jgi:hypothetical protein
MRLDVLGRRRALWCSMRRWRCMSLAAAKQYVPPPPLVLVLVLLQCLRLCLCLCVCSMLLAAASFVEAKRSICRGSSRCAEQPQTQECAAPKHGRDVVRVSACFCTLRRIKWVSSSSGQKRVCITTLSRVRYARLQQKL